MRLLRDKAALTRLLLLLEVQRTSHTTLRALAEPLGITVQGVSNYVTEAQRESLLRVAQGRYELTPKGTALLQEQLAELKGFVDVSWQRATVIDACVAVARTRVQAGDAVGLFLEEGLLVARARHESPSRGIATEDGKAGDLVRVRDLSGLVALPRGRLVVLKIPPVSGPATRRAAGALRSFLARERPKIRRIGAAGTEAVGVCAASRVEPDFVFAPAHAAHHAAQLGLHVALLAGPDQVRFTMAELDRLNEAALEPVNYELRELRVKA